MAWGWHKRTSKQVELSSFSIHASILSVRCSSELQGPIRFGSLRCAIWLIAIRSSEREIEPSRFTSRLSASLLTVRLLAHHLTCFDPLRLLPMPHNAPNLTLELL